MLAISTLGLKHDANVDTLKIVAALAICLAWIQLIFLFSRYPFLGGKFSIMYYSITKRIIKAAIGFLILLCAFTFSFYIIHFNQETESFETLFRSFIKVFVMTLGEFEFDDLWENSHQEGTEGYSQHFTMVLLVGLIIFGTISMVNLIIAIIITDIQGLQTVTKQQVLLHQVILPNTHLCPGSACCPSTCPPCPLQVAGSWQGRGLHPKGLCVHPQLGPLPPFCMQVRQRKTQH